MDAVRVVELYNMDAVRQGEICFGNMKMLHIECRIRMGSRAHSTGRLPRNMNIVEVLSIIHAERSFFHPDTGIIGGSRILCVRNNALLGIGHLIGLPRSDHNLDFPPP